MTMPLLRSSIAAAGGTVRRDPLALMEPESTLTRVVSCRASAGKKNHVEGIAQLYGTPNDRSEIFNLGGAAKTIQEQALKGRVKINDSHVWLGSHTHGLVTDARETDEGLWFEALWSEAADSQQIKTKMLEGILDEWSIEWRSIREDYEKVGDRYFRVVKEWQWVGLAICPHSAQGCPTTISVNSAVPYSDLPLAPQDTPWDAAAAKERVATWANGNYARVRRAHVWTNSADGMGLQIADVINGRLVAVPQALMRAAGALLDIDGAPEEIARGRAHVDRYFDRMRTEQNASGLITPWQYGAVDALLAQIRLNSGSVPAEHVAEVTDLIRTLSAALPTEARATLTAENQDAGPGQTPPTSETAAVDSDDVQQRAARGSQTELDELELELSLLT